SSQSFTFLVQCPSSCRCPLYPQKWTCAGQLGMSAFGKSGHRDMRGQPSISARWWRSVISLRSIVIGTAKRASEKATAPLGLGIVMAGLGPRDLILAARSNAGQYNLGILQANLLHQCIKRCGILT